MASERSLLNKIAVVSESAASFAGDSVAELCETIATKGFDAFIVWRYDKELDQRVPVQSTQSIKRAVSMAYELELIDHRGQAPSSVRDAMRTGEFSSLLAERVWRQLDRAGVTKQNFKAGCDRLITQIPDASPTPASLYEALSPNCTPRQFSAWLSLLGAARGIRVFQKRLYFISNGSS